MTAMRKTSGAILAAAAAALFAAGALNSVTVTPASAAEVKCGGLNACKGQSACKTASSSCKGLNACKGQGFLPTASADECTAKGGKVLG